MKNLLKIWSTLLISVFVNEVTFGQTAQEGTKFLEAEQFVKAKEVFTKLAATSPSAENYFYLGHYHLNNPNLDAKAAEEAFNKGLALDPKNLINKIGLGAVKLASKDLGGAKSIFDEVFKASKGKDLNLLYRLAEANIMIDDPKAKDAAEALKYLNLMPDVKKFAPTVDYFLTKGDVFLFKNDGGEAMSAYEKALPFNQKLAKVRSRMGQVWVQGKQYQKALDNFNAAVAADANFGPVYRQLGDFFVTYQRFSNAAENFKKYLTLTDADDNAKLRYAKLAFSAQDFDNAMQALEDVKERVKDPVVKRLIGMVQIEKGSDVEGGIKNIQSFISEASTDRVLGVDYGTIGRGYLKLKQDSLAIVNLEKAIALNDTSTDYASIIADTYYKGRNWKKASDAYSKIAQNRKKPISNDYYWIGLAEYQGKNWQKSIDAWTKCAEIAPNYSIAYRYIGMNYQKLDSADIKGLAAPAFDKFVSLETAKDLAKLDANGKRNLAYALKYLGRNALLNLKDIEKAKGLYTKALEIDPTDKQAIDAVARLNSGQDPFSTTPTVPQQNVPAPK